MQRWIEQWGVDETVALCKSNNERPVVSLRINNLLADRESLFRTLDHSNIEYRVHEDFPEFFYVADFSEFRKLDFLKRGWVTVQDISTGIPVRLLSPRPGETVLDMCAAPGGKSGYMAELMQNQGLILALEKHPGRARSLKDNLQRNGANVAAVVIGDGLKLPSARQFDKILLDAPCSGFGVLSKRVDLRWKRTLQDIQNMQRLQLELLKAAAHALRDGGVMVYSTCTIELEENEKVVERFLEETSGFVLDNLSEDIPDAYLWNRNSVRTFPHRHQMDGSFCVRLRKESGA